jgi:hypothetical protein
MKRIKINTTWEEDEEERRLYFVGLSYPERLKCFLKARKKLNFNKPPLKRFDFVVCDFKFLMGPYL